MCGASRQCPVLTSGSRTNEVREARLAHAGRAPATAVSHRHSDMPPAHLPGGCSMKRAILAATVAFAAIQSAYPAPASAARLTVQPSQFAHVIVMLKAQVDPSTVTGSSRHQRSRNLENRLRSTADTGQRGLLTLLR